MSKTCFVHETWSRRAVVAGLATLLGSGPSRSAEENAEGLRTSNFSDFETAVSMWAKVGGTLIVDRDHSFGAPITAILLPGLAYRLKSEGSRVLNYIGPAYHWAFSLYSEGKTAVLIEGDLTIDGADRVCIPFYAKFDKVEGGLRRDFSVDGLRCRNARMAHVLSPIDGAPINLYGACGMLFAGGFDHLHLRNVSVDNVTRAARAGTPFYQGSVGIGVVAKLNSTCSTRHVTIEEFAVSHVDSEDPPGSEHRVDMDGVLVFQSEEKDGSRPLIQSGIVREAAGRAVKIFAPGGGGVTRKIQIFRSVPSTIYGAVEIDHQHGDGVVAEQAWCEHADHRRDAAAASDRGRRCRVGEARGR